MQILSILISWLAAKRAINKVPRPCGVFFLILLLGSGQGMATASPVSHYTVRMGDAQTSHVYPRTSRVSITLTVTPTKRAENSSDTPLRYQWFDAEGLPLTEKTVLPVSELIALKAPVTEKTYVELRIEPRDKHVQVMDREPGEAMRYGFAQIDITPRLQRKSTRSPFGLVHTDKNDPFAPRGLKTLTWDTTPAEWWGHEIRQRRDRGFDELPIVAGRDWQSDDSQSLSQSAIDRMATRFAAYLRAAPEVRFWELGIEENLSSRFREAFYWPNLAKKSRAIQSVITQEKSRTKLIYQIAETRVAAVRDFLQSDAAANFDVLSLHPYAWPDFPDPERWLPEYLQQVRTEMRRADQIKPIWFTEIGAPLRGHVAEKFFGYPESNVAVPGFTDQQSVDYVIKVHVVALEQGVKKIHWYNYRDREAAREYAENHFGLIDVRGYPKPVYVAYLQLVDLLHDLKEVQHISAADAPLAQYQFTTERGLVDVFWSRSGTQQTLDLAQLKRQGELRILDAMGVPLAEQAGKVRIGPRPVYVITKQ